MSYIRSFRNITRTTFFSVIIVILNTSVITGCAHITNIMNPDAAEQSADTANTPAKKIVATNSTNKNSVRVEQSIIPPELERARPAYERAIQKVRSKDLDGALAAFRTLGHKYPELIGARLNEAIILIHRGEYQAANDVLIQAQTIAPKNPTIHNYLGITYRHLGQFKNAKAAYQKAISLEKNYANAHYNMGVLADLYLKDFSLAIAHYEAFQNLQNEPDRKVSGWIKDLNRRSQ